MNWQGNLAVQLVLFLNRLVPDLNAQTVQSKRSLAAYSQFEYSRAASAMRSFGNYFAVNDKDILDIGCGLGGSERYYLEQGARSVTAIDLSVPRLAAGQMYVRSAVSESVLQRIRFAATDARRFAFPDAAFDMIVSTNTFEHIFGVEPALNECKRVLKPGGRLLISFPPYRAPWGAHLSNWIHFPWCQIMFSEKVLVAAAKQTESQQQVNSWMPDAVRLDLEGYDAIPHLNRMSIKEFEAIMARISLKIVCMKCEVIGWRRGGLINRVGQRLAKNAKLREYVTSQAVYVLEKTVYD